MGAHPDSSQGLFRNRSALALASSPRPIAFLLELILWKPVPRSIRGVKPP
jgi:hypothetical protein